MKPIRYLGVLGEDYARLFLCDDGHPYVVKFYRVKHYRKREVVNEYVAGRLATKLHLPVSTIQIVNIPQELLSTIPRVKGSRLQGTVHLALRFIEGALPYKEVEREVSNRIITNRCQLADLIAFDLWIANMDRSRSNLLIHLKDRDRLSFHMIDHGKCFPGDYLWNESTLIEPPKYRFDMPIYKWALNQITRDELTRSIQKICSLHDTDIVEILNEIPDEWEVSEKERHALFSYLKMNRGHLPEIVESFLSFHTYDET